jgi:flagellar biosynthesis protein FlhF
MRIKSYFARSVEDALAMARQELGPEAMLVTTRHAPPEARHLGDFEVVFASDMPPDEGAPNPELAAAGTPAGDRLSVEVAELKRELEGMRRALTRTPFATPEWVGSAPDLTDAYAALAASEVPPELARNIIGCAQTRAAEARPAPPRAFERNEGTAFQQALAEELESRFNVEPLLGRSDARPRIMAAVGPPGSGKTTTLVKLAVTYGLAARRPALMLSVDNYRVGAAEQMRSYAAILGIGFQVLETIGALAQAIEENRGKELIFIDTPGLGPGDKDSSPDLVRWLSARNDVDVHLVLPAPMKSADLARVVDEFQAFCPQRLLFTRLDETGSFGPIFSEAVRTGKPLSFFATGQRIPEDLETASRSRLVELILAGQCGQARSAA